MVNSMDDIQLLLNRFILINCWEIQVQKVLLENFINILETTVITHLLMSVTSVRIHIPKLKLKCEYFHFLFLDNLTVKRWYSFLLIFLIFFKSKQLPNIQGTVSLNNKDKTTGFPHMNTLILRINNFWNLSC